MFGSKGRGKIKTWSLSEGPHGLVSVQQNKCDNRYTRSRKEWGE